MLSNLKIIIFGLFIILGSVSYAQLTEPGSGSGGGGAPNDSGIAGGGAPIGSGLALVLGLGLAYGAKKTFQLKSEEE